MQIIVAYRGIPQARGWALGACLARAFRRLGHQVTEHGRYYQTAEWIEDEPLPDSADLLVYCECNDPEPQYRRLKSVRTRWKAYWDFDVHTHPGATLAFVKDMGFTHVFCANKLYQALFSAVCSHAYYLPIGVDEELCRPLAGVTRSVAVGLCGTPYPGRVALVGTLTDAGLDARLQGGVYAERYVEALNSYRIGLNSEVGGGRGLLPGRVWETLACRTLLLTERADFIDLFFRDMHDLVTFSGPDECLEKCRFLLSHDAERERIATQGYQAVLDAHTYRHRAQAILDAVTEDQRPAWDQNVPKGSRSAHRAAHALILRHQIAGLPGMSYVTNSLRRLRTR